MRISLFTCFLILVTIKTNGQTANSEPGDTVLFKILYTTDTTIFDISSVDGERYYDVKNDSVLKKGSYRLVQKLRKKKFRIVQSFNIGSDGKYCGERIFYYFNGTIESRVDMGKCN